MSSKVVIGFLSSVLAAVIVLFLVSEYKNQLELASNESSAISPVPHLKSAVHAHNSTSEQSDSNNADHIPDKSLPIPAHQLKKLLVEQASSKDSLANEAMSDNPVLNERINRLNADLSVLDKRVKTSSQLTDKQSTQSQLAVTLDNNIADRVQHIREHLDTTSQQ